MVIQKTPRPNHMGINGVIRFSFHPVIDTHGPPSHLRTSIPHTCKYTCTCGVSLVGTHMFEWNSVAAPAKRPFLSASPFCFSSSRIVFVGIANRSYNHLRFGKKLQCFHRSVNGYGWYLSSFRHSANIICFFFFCS